MNLAKNFRADRGTRLLSALSFFLLVAFQSVGNAAEILVTPPAEAQRKIAPCGERPEIFSEHSFVIAFDSLPKSIFVGRVAHFWIESKDGLIKVLIKQNFKTGKKEFVCANLSESLTEHFSLMAPTLIDRSNSQKAGSTMWQFQVLAQGNRLGIWNQKSKLVTLADFLKPKSTVESVQWIEDDHLRIHRSAGKFDLYLVIEYDQVDSSAF